MQEQQRLSTHVKKLNIFLDLLASYKAQLGIVERWTPHDQAYLGAKAQESAQKLNKAIDTVERLMIQRFMEQDKLGVAGLCEYLLVTVFSH